jgi:hypothetical protein
MSTADHVTCCCTDTLAEVARLTAERDRARALAIRLEAEAAQPYLPASLCEGWNVRDLADELLTLQPVDPARCNPRRKAHPVMGGRELECGECWRVRVVERLEQWRRSVEDQEGAESAPSRAADGLEGLDWHLCDMTDQCASSPTAAAEARDIVRSGLRDVLDWLGEGDSPGPDAEMAGGDDDAEWTESLDELRAERDRFLDLAEQAGWTIRKFLEQRDEARAAAKKLRDALDRERAKVERVREIAEGWRYKGEFGWGSWQIGEGPDPDGYVLDHAAGKIRAALSADQPDDDAEWDAREAIVRARGGR